MIKADIVFGLQALERQLQRMKKPCRDFCMSCMYIKQSMTIRTQIIILQDKDVLTLLPLPTAGLSILVSTRLRVPPKMETVILPLVVPEVAAMLTRAELPVVPVIKPSVIYVQTSCVKVATPILLV